MKKGKGFTIIEVAIVMVIVGLLLGGVLRGQELIVAARVRTFAAQMEHVKIAHFGFLDRFRAIPGDMGTAAANALMPGSPGGCTGGAGCGNGVIDADEVYVVWAQLSHSGFITNRYNGTILLAAPSITTNPTNPFGGYLHLITDVQYDDVLDPAQSRVLNIKTGTQVPTSVLAELDRKFDDGAPLTGVFRSYGYTGTTTFDNVKCPLVGTPPQWSSSSANENCGGAIIQ